MRWGHVTLVKMGFPSLKQVVCTAWKAARASRGETPEDQAQKRLASLAGLPLLSLAVLAIDVQAVLAAPQLTQLQRAHGGADVTYVTTSSAGPLTQLQRAHDGASIAYVNARGVATGIGMPLVAASAMGSATSRSASSSIVDFATAGECVSSR